MLRQRLQLQVNRVQSHQWLTTFNALASIHKTFEDLTLHPETKIALRSCYHHAGKAPGSGVREFNGPGSDERRPRARIVISGIVAAGPQDERQEADGKAG
ncbi:hypothetical protein NUITMVR1_32970 [Raoultella ornithinolytica]|nr:hypothetical protein NUITMVR1_32970 [Raoultella ornithinolytica]